jgi:ABC-2 type transport system permease protein
MSTTATTIRPPISDSARSTAAESAIQPHAWLAAWTLCRREWVRFIRQGNRVFAALGQPIIFWVLLAGLLDPSFHATGAAGEAASAASVSYGAYFFPGILVLILLFTAIFTTISIIEDRREGFLQSVLVAPVPRWSMVAGKVLGGSLIALAHAAVFLLLGFTTNVSLTLITIPLAVIDLFIIAVALTSLGTAIAWRMQSTQGYHAIMMVFLLPMWLLSGAFAPRGDNWLAWLIRLNPLTYCIALLRRILYLDATAEVRDAALAGLPPTWLCIVVTLGFAALMFALAWRVATVRTAGDAI